MSSLTLTSPVGPPFLTSGLVISASSDFFASFVAGLDLDSLDPGLALVLSLATGLVLSLGLVLTSLAAGLVLLSLGLPLASFSFGLALSLGLSLPLDALSLGLTLPLAALSLGLSLPLAALSLGLPLVALSLGLPLVALSLGLALASEGLATQFPSVCDCPSPLASFSSPLVAAAASFASFSALAFSQDS